MIYDDSTYLRSLFNEHQSNEEFSNVVLSTNYPNGKRFISLELISSKAELIDLSRVKS